MERKKVRKILAILAIAVAAVTAAFCCTIYALWRDEVRTLCSFRELRTGSDADQEGSVYEMTVSGGFYLDDFVAQGGVSSDEELSSFIFDHVTKGLADIRIDLPNVGCSSFTAKTTDGDALFARNYDGDEASTCIIHTNAGNGRHATISTADLSHVGLKNGRQITELTDRIRTLAAVYAPLDGMNDAGVACAVYKSFQGGGSYEISTNQLTDRPDFTSTTFLRLVLDYADDLDEAIEIAQSYDMHDSAGSSFHYMIADASGRSAVLEWINPDKTDSTDTDGRARTLVIYYSDDDASVGDQEAASDVQWITNFILKPGYYVSARGMTGYDRYQELGNQLTARGGTVADEAEAMNLLRLVGRRSWDAGHGSSRSLTIHSAVYNLTDRTLLWVPNENYDDAAAVFRFEIK